MSLYLDTSCLLKLFFLEPESARVAEIIARESHVVVSTLVKLESIVQIQARHLGGSLTKKIAHNLVAALDKTLSLEPYTLSAPGADLASLREAQVRTPGVRRHCRTLDRLHLAAMEALAVRRLLTNDDIQAASARELGFEVLMPR